MGGFVLLHTIPGEDRSAMQEAALSAFAQMGLSPPRLIRGENYVLAVFPKRQSRELAVAQFPNGDFVFTCGTLIYNSAVGKSAATAFKTIAKSRAGPTRRSAIMLQFCARTAKLGSFSTASVAFSYFMIRGAASRRLRS